MYRVIGHPTPRVDGPDKVTGKALYTADVHLPGTLWGKVIRSPFPHALITRLDTTSAKDIPGVHAILTGDDVRGVLYGRRLIDVPVLAQGRVRFVGEPVAAVAAVDQDTAQEALDLIEVEYQELPAVFLPLEALKEDAPILHPEVNSYEGLPKPQENPSNAFVRDTWGKGDLEEGFQQAEVIVENTFHTPPVHHAYLEPHCCLVWIDKNSRIQIWAPNKVPYMLRRQIAQALNIPEGRILVNHAHIGGDFGGKGSPMSIPLCYFLALHSGRPVKMVMDYVEEFTAGNPRHGSVVQLKSGVKRDGTLVASQVKVIFNSGAYGGFKPGSKVNLTGPEHAINSYRVPHLSVETMRVYTNTVPCGFMRAPGAPQVAFAWESHLDMISRQMEIDPLEFRLRNLIRQGEKTSTDIRYKTVKAKETLMLAADYAQYQAPKPSNIGRGMAISERGIHGGESHAKVTLNLDGSVTVHTPVFEQGSGTYTVLRQVVAEEMGLSPELVQILIWDTDAIPFDAGIGGSRAVRMSTVAVHEGVRKARQELFRLAEEILGWPKEHLVLEGRHIMDKARQERIQWSDLLLRAGQPICALGSHTDQEHAPTTSFTAQVAEVSVDIETGQVKLLKLTNAQDVGTIINPTGHIGQIYGGAMQGIGYALMEELQMEEGHVINPSFGDYKIPSIEDIPEMTVAFLRSGVGTGPYRVKSIGESTIVPVAAAIANAVHDAVGVRITELPITAEKVYRALKDHPIRESGSDTKADCRKLY
jgi:CO/xanthine dehydrogenase Mo-binding subunit